MDIPAPRSIALGRIVATANAISTLCEPDIIIALRRHQAGDWGDLCPDDKAANDLAVLDGSRLLSAYTSESGVKFWIITESDRSITTILLPEDY